MCTCRVYFLHYPDSPWRVRGGGAALCEDALTGNEVRQQAGTSTPGANQLCSSDGSEGFKPFIVPRPPQNLLSN